MRIISPGYANTNVAALYAAAAGGSSLLLDTGIATAGNAYSLRKLRSAYAGSAIKVRRSSDNATQDIGFSGSDLDTASLASFVGANSAYVDTWYDQVGSNNLTTASNGVQPRIVNAGALDTKNSKPSMVFDGTDDTLVATNPAGLSGASKFTVSYIVSATGGSRIVSFVTPGGSDYGAPDGVIPAYVNGSTIDTIRGYSNVTGSSYTSGQLFSGFTIYDATQALITLDGTTTTPGAFSETALTGSTSRFAVGSNAGSLGECFTGTVSEVVIWSSALSSGDKTTLISNTKTYWGTP